jgi:hypothetical protein
MGPETTPGLTTGSPIEPLVAINPTDPANVVISSQNGLEVSTNAGRTFSSTNSFPLVAGASSDNGDTAMAFDSQGRLFWANLETISTGGRDVVVTQVDPTTGGIIGGSEVRIPNPNTRTSDKEFLAADTNPHSPDHDNLYVSFDMYNSTTDEFEVFVSRSTDQGQTWSTPLQLSVNSGTNSEGFTWPSTVSVASNGDVYVAYHSQSDLTDTNVEGGSPDNAALVPLTTTGSGKNPDGTHGQEIVFRSTDGGQTFPQRSVPFDSGQADITFNRQDATNGRTIPGTKFWTMGSTQPWVLTDPARPGNIYVIAADDPFDGAGGNTDPSNVLVTRSMDSGQTWSSPQDVDVGTTVPGTSSNSFQLFPTAAIDQSGNIVVAWYDNRQGLTNSGGDYLLDVYARYSTDGALTWSNPFQVNSTHFDPDPGAINRFNGPPATTRIGEYFGIAMSNGLAYVAWNGNTFDPHGAANGQQVYFRDFQINGSLMLTQPNDILTHNLKIDLLPGGPSNFLEILDASGTPLTSQRVYVGMGDFLSGISIVDDSNSSNIYDIENTFFGDNVDIHFAGQGGNVVISNIAENLDNIAGNVNIFSGFGFGSTLIVLDANDPNAGDAWTITRSSIQRFGAGAITYDGMDGLGIRGGDLGATYNVLSTEGATMTSIVGGVSGDVFNVQATSGPLRIDGTDSTNGLLDTVNVGSLAPALGGTMAGIQGALSIGSSMNKINIDLDDSGDTTGRAVTVTGSAVTGLAPAEIDYTSSQVNDLIILGGNGADTFTLRTVLPSLGISGGGGINTLVGPNMTNAWEVTGPGAGSVDGMSFSHMGILRGGAMANTFQFGPMGSVPVLLDGGGGSSNTLDYSTDGGAAATINLQTRAASRVAGGAAGGFRAIQRLVGSTGGGDTLVGPDANITWNITGANAGTLGGVTFAGFENIRGGSQNDAFRFGPAGILGGVVDGGGGFNVLDYSIDGGRAATVNLQTRAASLVHAALPGGFQHIQAVVGSTATSDRLIGTNSPTLWQITSSNAGMAGGVAFSGIENVQGGTASDTFKFSPKGSLSGSLTGGGGGDWLDYSLFTTPVIVNLSTGAASRVAGAATGKVSQVRNVVGGAGNDMLVGNALGNILIGGSATNVITGGSGRSLLVGGTGSATIKGGSADDILIAGTTSFDSNHAALMSILAEWQRTDKTYAQRIADLRNGGGLNGTTKLIRGTTVLDDDGSDTLTGGPGLDWFFANLGPGGVLDHITDRNNGGPEQVN